MAEVKVWFGIGVWRCNACPAPWHTGYATAAGTAAAIIEHIERHHPRLAGDLPLAKHGEWSAASPNCDLTPASDG